MNITVTHTIHPEVIKLLEAALNNTGGTTAPVTKTKKALPAKEGVQTVVDAPSAETSAEQTSSITIEQVRAAVQAKSKGGKRPQIKALLAEFGVENVSSLQPDQYTDFHAKVQAI